MTFTCPVAFAGTYLVENVAVPPTFAGGATATYPDASLTGMNGPSHTLSGNITFTQNWTIPQQPNGVPFVVAANSTVTGKTLAGVTNAPLSLVVGKDAVAENSRRPATSPLAPTARRATSAPARATKAPWRRTASTRT